MLPEAARIDGDPILLLMGLVVVRDAWTAESECALARVFSFPSIWPRARGRVCIIIIICKRALGVCTLVATARGSLVDLRMH